jgi:S-adenosylmethionine/arginine decarboxylase-like enzyme
MGKHYLLNLFGCSFVLLNDEHYLMELLEQAAAASGATVCQTIFKKFDPQGVTVLCLLSESHISIHGLKMVKLRVMFILVVIAIQKLVVI